MKTTGIYRRVDNLGRIVIPKKIRKILGIKEGDSLEVFTNKNEIILKRYNIAIGLKELVQRLSEEFFDERNNMEIEVANSIYEHINALQKILEDID